MKLVIDRNSADCIAFSTNNKKQLISENCYASLQLKPVHSYYRHLTKDWSPVHTTNISIRTKSKRKQSVISPQGLVKIKQQQFLFVSSFVRLLAYAWTMILCLWLRRSLCRRLDFIPLFCHLFCPYAYVYAHVWTRFYSYQQTIDHTRIHTDPPRSLIRVRTHEHSNHVHTHAHQWHTRLLWYKQPN